MGRPKTSSTILDARGAFKKHPERKNKKEPKPSGVFPEDAPEYFIDAEKKIWDQVRSIAPAGVLTSADVMSVEVICVLLCEFRIQKAEMAAAKMSRLCNELKAIGLNPSGRAGLSVDVPKANEFL